MRNPFDIRNMAFVVFGGAGHIGRWIVSGLAAHGAHVLCLSSRKPELPDGASTNGSVMSFAVELTDYEMVLDLIRRFTGVHLRLDGVVNLATRGTRIADTNMSPDEFAAAMENASGLNFALTGIALRHLTEPASIVNLASMWGAVAPDERTYVGGAKGPSFATPAAHAGILALTRHLAVHLAPRKIRVNAIVPGWFPAKRGPDNPEYMAQVESRIPMARIGQPHELIGAAIFLLSEASSYCTGIALNVDGGYTLR